MDDDNKDFFDSQIEKIKLDDDLSDAQKKAEIELIERSTIFEERLINGGRVSKSVLMYMESNDLAHLDISYQSLLMINFLMRKVFKLEMQLATLEVSMQIMGSDERVYKC